MELDQSSISDLCRAQECSNNIIISDACERLRSGRMRIESSSVRRPKPFPMLCLNSAHHIHLGYVRLGAAVIVDCSFSRVSFYKHTLQTW